MACTFCTGLHLCARHHPPLVTFFLCLLTLATTFLCFGVYIRAYPVKDADFTKDFDTVLQTLSAGPICPQRNATAPAAPSEPPQALAGGPAAGLGSVSVLISVTLSPWQRSANYSGLQICATASQLGMKGSSTGSDTDPHLLLTVSSSWWSAQCNESDTECSGKFCLTVIGPQSSLPLSWSPLHCSPANPNRPQLLPELYEVAGGSDTSSQCYSLQYSGDPLLKAMMSLVDSSTSSARLLVAMLCCLLAALVLLVCSACWIHPMKEKRTPGAL
ncbi:insulin-like growth factor-binding protein 3 receptor [Dendropsophus ebraccatus]|uniref:insulin-like growth factor-binding protein 3 receptor n=1 Tax=Dendropsophus ebraccatus TaxID=150705 RepID=UPI00383226CD